jgi:hypothetical protein
VDGHGDDVRRIAGQRQPRIVGAEVRYDALPQRRGMLRLVIEDEGDPLDRQDQLRWRQPLHRHDFGEHAEAFGGHPAGSGEQQCGGGESEAERFTVRRA